ncbi:hypothetical protein E7T06_13410 [Deinococcus sp. Arct2-2]|uniref:hypothetical protein n=1 Tax=Deinococcus sp. Arct2-2 TaxID=2568653 RepID=UPI0010A4A4F8|nr:hypothetical protein [Deinococcus sp. Arct2-2]THF69157.1 hypothetical protein E7T06_13410 [Deinococcus sp. Arct2-2]
MRVLAWILTLLLVLFGVGLAALTLGAFAALSAGAPLWLRSVGSLENAMSAGLGWADVPGFTRALVLAVLCSAVAALGAYIKPR